MATMAIGIDPDKGLAVWDCQYKRFLRVSTVDFWQIDDILRHAATWSSGAVVYCEAPHMNRPTWIEGQNARTQDKINQNVGENKAKAKLIIDLCAHLGLKCYPCRPTKNSMTKLSAERFAEVTGWKDRTSEHARDAAMLVWGM